MRCYILQTFPKPCHINPIELVRWTGTSKKQRSLTILIANKKAFKVNLAVFASEEEDKLDGNMKMFSIVKGSCEIDYEFCKRANSGIF